MYMCVRSIAFTPGSMNFRLDFWTVPTVWYFSFFMLLITRIRIANYRFEWIRRVWRYQRGNQNPYIQKDKQRSTQHTYKTKDRAIRTSLKTGGELRCSGRVASSYSTSGTRRVNLVTNPVICHECVLISNRKEYV
jgi:hypothetical protein